MAPKSMARIAPRPRPVWLIATGVLALLATTGCNGHHREALRPVYSTPAAAAAPCTNCGPGSGAVVAEPAPGAPTGAAPRALPSEPALEGPAGTAESTVPSLGAPAGSTVPSLGAPAGSTQSSQRKVLPERAPNAVIGDEPDLDMIPSQSTRPRGSQAPSSPAPASKPALQGPSSSTQPGPSSSTQPSLNPTDGIRTTSANSPVRQASAQQRLNPYFGASGGNELFYPSKADRPWKYIVLHHSANSTGNYDQIDHEHRKILGYDGCGYHFVIGNGTGSEDGQIEVAQRWVDQKHGVHCRNAKNAEVDEYGIGICFIGNLDKQPPTPRQVAAAKALIAYLSSRYGIARSRIETHAHLAATPTVCPGRHFPMQVILAADPRVRSHEATASRPRPTSWQMAQRPGLEVY